MKVKYMAMVATVSLLSVGGLVIGCANPCAATDKGTETTETKENPCAAKSDNPCAAKSDNPCAGQ